MPPAQSQRPCPLCGETKTTPERRIESWSLVRCSSCPLVFANLSRDQAEAANTWSADSAARDNARRRFGMLAAADERAARIMLRHLDATAPKRLLDFGCGQGGFLLMARAAGWDAVGLERAPWGRIAEERGFDVRRCDLTEAGFQPGEFGAIHSNAVLEHLYDPLPVLRELRNLLDPGGVCHARGIPNYGSLSIRLGLNTFYHNHPPHHVSYWTPASLRAAFVEAGYSHIHVRTYGTNVMWLHDAIAARKWGTPAHRQTTTPSSDASPGVDTSTPRVVHRLAAQLYWKIRLPGMGTKLEVFARR